MAATVDRTKYMDLREVKQLRTAAELWAMKDLRAGRKTGVLNWAVVDTALATGLRVSELAALNVGDVDFDRQGIRVTRRKRRRPLTETIAMADDLAKHLREYIAWKADADQSIEPDAPLFVGKRGRLSASGLQRLWKRVIAEAGLPRELSIHSARHTLAVHLLRNTGNLRMVQKQLGHAKPDTTANLYADVSFEDMQAGLNGLYDGKDRRTR